jgi:subtilisin family serine protease
MLLESVTHFFGPDFDDRLPGELLVKVKGGGRTRVAVSMEVGVLTRSRRVPGVRSDINEFNRIISELPLESITRLYGPLRATTSAQEIGDEDLTSTYRLRFKDSQIDLDKIEEQLREIPAVVSVSPNRFQFAFSKIVPDDLHYSLQWGLERIKCPEAWEYTTGSDSVVVAVVDSGVDLDHPDLHKRLLPGYNMVNLVGQSPPEDWKWDGHYQTRDANSQDEVGHGTHVAGIIAAMTNNKIGVAGVTWFSKILPVRVLARMIRESDGAIVASGIASDIADGIRWAADHGAHVINLSLGSYQETFIQEDAVKYARDKGCLVVAAMGNDGTDEPAFPAAFPDVVAVGAVDRLDRRAAWSNIGSHISLVAPGVDIFSTYLKDDYKSKDGTSMAAPHVSGAAALVKSCNPSLTASEIAQILKDTAYTISQQVPDDQYGYGLVDACAAVEAACNKAGS